MSERKSDENSMYTCENADDAGHVFCKLETGKRLQSQSGQDIVRCKL